MGLFKIKTWKDRISEYPTRRKLIKENGTTELVTVARSEGEISQEGDAFSANNMNDLETRIQTAIGTGDIPEELGTDIISAITALNTGLGGLKLVTMAQAEYEALENYDANTLYFLLEVKEE